MSRWVDVDATVRVYLPDGAPDENRMGETLAEQATLAVMVVADQQTTSRGLLLSVLSTDAGEICNDEATT